MITTLKSRLGVTINCNSIQKTRNRDTRRHFCNSSSKSWRVLLFGSGDVSLATAQLLHSRKGLISKLEVVCPPQKDAKFTLPTLEWAKKNQIVTHTYIAPVKSITSQNTIDVQKEEYTQVSEHEEVCKRLEGLAKSEFDVGVVVDFGYLLPSSILASFPNTPILMHPSLLPKYRGAAPIEHAIMNGEKETGITVLEVHPNAFDSGRVLLSKSYSVPLDSDIKSIRSDLAKLGAQGIIECLENYEVMMKKAKPQGLDFTKAPKLKSHHHLAHFDKQNPPQLHYKARALGSLTTVLYGSTGIATTGDDGGIKVIIHKIPAKVADSPHPFNFPNDAAPGTLVFDKHRNLIWVYCINHSCELYQGTDGHWVPVEKLQFESGRKILDAISFANGVKFKSNPSQYFAQDLRS